MPGTLSFEPSKLGGKNVILDTSHFLGEQNQRYLNHFEKVHMESNSSSMQLNSNICISKLRKNRIPLWLQNHIFTMFERNNTKERK